MIYIKTPNQKPNDWLLCEIVGIFFNRNSSGGTVKVRGIVPGPVTTNIQVSKLAECMEGEAVDSQHGYFKLKMDLNNEKTIALVAACFGKTGTPPDHIAHVGLADGKTAEQK